MFRKKIPKSQQPAKAPYTLYNPHSRSLDERQWNQNFFRICSIDPARDNFAIRVETRPKDHETEDFITCQLFEKLDLRKMAVVLDNPGDYLKIFDVLSSFLDLHLELLQTCHIFVMERQQIPENVWTNRIAQHTLSYLLLKMKDTPLLPIILEIDPKVKGQQLEAPTGLNYNALKKWSTETAISLLTLRQDEYSLAVFSKYKTKKDDLADTVCQIEALFRLFGWPPTRPPPEIPELHPKFKPIYIKKN